MTKTRIRGAHIRETVVVSQAHTAVVTQAQRVEQVQHLSLLLWRGGRIAMVDLIVAHPVEGRRADFFVVVVVVGHIREVVVEERMREVLH